MNWQAVLTLVVTLLGSHATPALRQLSLLGAGGVGLAPPNAAVVATTACSSNATGGSTACTITTTTAGGHTLAYWEFDYQTTSNGTVPTDNLGSTWAQTCTWNTSIRASLYTLANAAAGITTVTTHPAGGSRTNGQIYELSGVNVSSLSDGCGTILSASGAQQQSFPILGTQYDVALAATFTSNTATPAMVVGDNWTNTVNSASSGGATADSFSGVNLNGYGQFTYPTTNGSAGSTYRNYIALFKTTNAGSAPSAQLNTSLIDWNGGSNGDAFTQAKVLASIHGGMANVSVVGTSLNFSTTQTNTPTQSQLANGATFTASSPFKSLVYDIGNNANVQDTLLIPNSPSKIAAGYWFYSGANDTTGARMDPVTINSASAGDFLVIQWIGTIGGTPQLVLHAKGADGTPVNISNNAWYRVGICFNAGGTHEGYVYDANNTLVLHQTVAATTSNAVVNVSFGNGHNNGSSTAGVLKYIGPTVVDYNTTNPTCPFLP